MATVVDDPLRAARHAVQAGRFRQGWDLLARQPDPVRHSPEWLLLAAMARWRLGEFAAARSAAHQARDGYRALGDGDGEMRAENVAAAGAFALGDLAEAERGFARALALAARRSDELMLARCANNLGNIAFYLARNTAALSFYRLAVSRFERVGLEYGVAETQINTGVVWRDLGYTRDSLEAAERALDIAERIESPRLTAQALAMRGEALALLGDAPLGRAQAARALVLARTDEDHLAEIEALRILCNIERDSHPETAERYGLEALALATEVANPWDIGEVNRDLGELYAHRGQSAEAAARFTAAAAAYARLGASPRAEKMEERARAVGPR